MTEEQLKERSYEIAQELIDLATQMCPEDFSGLFAGVIVAVACKMPEDYFERFAAPGPCGNPGCDCHIRYAPLMDAIRAFRIRNN